MALAQRLELRQGQSLVMTPQLQQAIKLLQLSNLELADYVEAELERIRCWSARTPSAAEREARAAEAPRKHGAGSTKTLDARGFRHRRDIDAGARRSLYGRKPRRAQADAPPTSLRRR